MVDILNMSTNLDKALEMNSLYIDVDSQLERKIAEWLKIDYLTLEVLPSDNVVKYKEKQEIDMYDSKVQLKTFSCTTRSFDLVSFTVPKILTSFICDIHPLTNRLAMSIYNEVKGSDFELISKPMDLGVEIREPDKEYTHSLFRNQNKVYFGLTYDREKWDSQYTLSVLIGIKKSDD